MKFLALAGLAISACIVMGCRSLVLHVNPGSWEVLRPIGSKSTVLVHAFECEPRLECHFGYGKPPLVCGIMSADGDFAAADIVSDEERGGALWGPKRFRRYQARFDLDGSNSVRGVLCHKDAVFILKDGMIIGGSVLYREVVDVKAVRDLLDTSAPGR